MFEITIKRVEHECKSKAILEKMHYCIIISNFRLAALKFLTLDA